MNGGFDPISEADARQRIDKLQKADTTTQSIDELKKLINHRAMRNVGVPLAEGNSIYRARKFDNKPTRISDLSYPPKEITPLNRANRENDPIFYGSSSAGAVTFELDPNPGENLCIIRWRLTDDILLNTIGYSPDVLDRLNSSRDPGDIEGIHQADSESKGNAMIREYIAELFTKRVPENKKNTAIN